MSTQHVISVVWNFKHEVILNSGLLGICFLYVKYAVEYFCLIICVHKLGVFKIKDTFLINQGWPTSPVNKCG